MIRLALRVGRAHAELALAELLELAPSGVEEIELPARDGVEEQIEYAVYGAPGELPELGALRALAGGTPVEIATSEIPDDWSERWKRWHRPVLIAAPAANVPARGLDADVEASAGDRRARADASTSARTSVPSLRIRPPWEPATVAAHTEEIAIDPAQAFGTGAHATTRLCLQLQLALAGADPRRGRVLDVGAGSGVLAIAAARLGYDPVLALDNDRHSVVAVADNAAANEVHVTARRFDLRSEPLPDYDRSTVVLANLLRPLLLDLERSLPHAPVHLIASGLLCAEAEEVSRVFTQRLGMVERERPQGGEWAALWLSAR